MIFQINPTNSSCVFFLPAGFDANQTLSALGYMTFPEYIASSLHNKASRSRHPSSLCVFVLSSRIAL